MRIKRNFLRCKTLIIFFSILCNVVVPVFARINRSLRSGGQLFKSMQLDGQDIDILDISANTEMSSGKKAPEKKTEVTEKAAKKTESKREAEKKSETKKEDKEAAKKKVKVLKKTLDKKAIDKKKKAPAKKRPAKKKKDEEKIVFNFEDVDLANVAAYVEKLFDVKFITDEILKPTPKGGKALSGNKISFKTQKPLTKKQAWSLFITFLNMVGFTLVPQGQGNQKADEIKLYRIMVIQGAANQTDARRSAIPSYIGVDPDKLPDNDLVIRYGYFVKDCPLETIKKVIESLKSTFADLLILNDHKAFILTDSAYNIKVLMKIVKELDRVTMPQSMSVVRLYKVDAEYVKQIYSALVKDDQEGTVAARIFGPRKPSKALYFPKNTKMIVEFRTNSLVLLGTDDGIKKVEKFVKKYIDVDITAPYSPLNVYPLKYADAKDIAEIMRNLVQFGTEKQRGGIRAGEKYFKNMTFTPETEGNRLIIRGDYDDYLKVTDIIAKLDAPPAQVAIEILLLGVDVQSQKDLGAQIRNKFRTPDGQKINFQTSGITLGGSPSQIVLNTDTGAKGNLRLLGDLVNLIVGATAGNTVVSLGSDKYGIWGVFGVLDTITNTQILSNPFLTATNNTKAKVKLGETKRIVTATVQGSGAPTSAFGDYEAKIEVEVKPKINSDGMIVMEIVIIFDSFVGDLAKNTRRVETAVILNNNEVLALGGLLKEEDTDTFSKTPILGNVPILGWLFKNKQKIKIKQDLLVLLTASIIKPEEKVTRFTKRHLREYRDTLNQFDIVKNKRDPVDRAFFPDDRTDFELDNYIFTRGKEKHANIQKNVKPETTVTSKRRKRRTSKKKIQKTPEKLDQQVKNSKSFSRKERRKKRRKGRKETCCQKDSCSKKDTKGKQLEVEQEKTKPAKKVDETKDKPDGPKQVVV